MKTKVQVYACDVDRKLALIALLKDASCHEQVINDLSASLETGNSYTRQFEVDAVVGAA